MKFSSWRSVIMVMKEIWCSVLLIRLIKPKSRTSEFSIALACSQMLVEKWTKKERFQHVFFFKQYKAFLYLFSLVFIHVLCSVCSHFNWTLWFVVVSCSGHFKGDEKPSIFKCLFQRLELGIMMKNMYAVVSSSYKYLY